jgi:hypothetical protein
VTAKWIVSAILASGITAPAFAQVGQGRPWLELWRCYQHLGVSWLVEWVRKCHRANSWLTIFGSWMV